MAARGWWGSAASLARLRGCMAGHAGRRPRCRADPPPSPLPSALPPPGPVPPQASAWPRTTTRTWAPRWWMVPSRRWSGTGEVPVGRGSPRVLGWTGALRQEGRRRAHASAGAAASTCRLAPPLQAGPHHQDRVRPVPRARAGVVGGGPRALLGDGRPGPRQRAPAWAAPGPGRFRRLLQLPAVMGSHASLRSSTVG